ncbi:NUDIX hydrolase [Sporolactobacillus pectinivorans]|uniref:NUDIX hydrolase n=1 Tax=Sporolactobacillus pectinivorans TaxID=1591408 RepID=UPI001EFDD584|nr:NUDIX domain-containing protein [Sporolactobacillus pectinivorans]
MIHFYDLETIENQRLKYVVIASKMKEKWVFVKHRERKTWEIPGGKIEKGESTDAAARRELWEETGAQQFTLMPVCIYSVLKENDESFGQLFLSHIFVLGDLPASEIGEVKLFDCLPECLTYPAIQPLLFSRVQEKIGSNYYCETDEQHNSKKE